MIAEIHAHLDDRPLAEDFSTMITAATNTGHGASGMYALSFAFA